MNSENAAASEQHDGDWPFAEPPGTLVITTRQVIERGLPILLVTHDVDDGAWQFLHGDNAKEQDARIVRLDEILARDPSVRALAGLLRGWQASRRSPDASWEQAPILDPV